MSSKGLKKPLEPASLLDVQPVSDSDDDQSSAECLLPLQPDEDDYSSVDEAQKKMANSSSNDVFKSQPKNPEKNACLNKMLLDRIIYSYSLKLLSPHKLPPKYADIADSKSDCFVEMESVCDEDVLEMLFSFITENPPSLKDNPPSPKENPPSPKENPPSPKDNPLSPKDNPPSPKENPPSPKDNPPLPKDNPPSPKDFMDEVCADGEMGCLSLLRINQSFKAAKFEPGSKEHSCRGQLERISEKLEITKEMLSDENKPMRNTFEHDIVKDFLVSFCNDIISDGILTNGASIFALLVDTIPKSNHRPTRKASRMEATDITCVTVVPDLTIGQNYTLAATPVEIFSPHVYETDAVFPCYHSTDTEEEQEYINLPDFLKSVPFRGPSKSISSFKCEITVQLLLQLLASCKEYSSKRRELCLPSNELRAFIGVFAHHFDVYLIKIECSELDLHRMFQVTVKSTSIKSPTVQFFPVPLNLANPQHAIAFSFFLKYYRNYYKVKN